MINRYPVTATSLCDSRGMVVCLAAVCAGLFSAPLLAANERPELFLQTGHVHSVTSVALSADGRYALSGSRDNTLALWDLVSGKQIRQFTGHASLVKAVAFTPEGKHAVSASFDKTLKVWDIETGKEVRTFTGHTDIINAMSVSPDGRLVASVSGDRTVRLWEVASGKEVKVLSGHGGWVLSVAFSADGHLLASGDVKNQIKLWDVSNGREVQSIAVPLPQKNPSGITALAISPDGRQLLTGVRANNGDLLWLWDIASGRELRSFRGHSDWISAVAFAPDGRHFFTASFDKTVKMWEAATGKELRTFSGPRKEVTAIAVSRDGSQLLIGGTNHKPVLWDTSSGTMLRPYEGHSMAVGAVVFSPDGQSLITAGTENRFSVWDAGSGRLRRQFTSSQSRENDAAEDDSEADDGPSDRGQKKARPESQLKQAGHKIRERAPFTGGTHADVSVARNLAESIDSENISMAAISAAAVSPDNSRVVVNGPGHTFTLSDLRNGKVIQKVFWHSKRVNAVAISPDGRMIAAASADHSLSLWDAGTLRKMRDWDGHEDRVTSVAFSRDGRFLVSGSWDGSAVLWDVASGSEVKKFRLADGMIFTVAISPDGRRLATGDSTNQVRVWDVQSGKELSRLSGHGNWVRSAAYSPDGQKIVSGSMDGTIRIWDASNGNSIRVLRAHTAQVLSVAFSPDGSRVLSGSRDGSARVWDSRTGQELVQLAAMRNGEWVSITPDGYFDASAQGSKYLNVRFGNNVHALDQFMETFFRPDYLKVALASGRMAAVPLPAAASAPAVVTAPVAARPPEAPAPESQKPAPVLPPPPAVAASLPAPVAMAAPPRLALASVRLAPSVKFMDAPATVGSDTARIRLIITDLGGGVGQLRLYLNGSAVLLEGTRNLQVAAVSGAGRELEYQLKLVPGKNTVRALAFNADNTMQSDDALQEITSTVATQKRPSLHAIVVGIKQFVNPKLALNYTVADAELFASVLETNAAGLFQTVNIKKLITPPETTNLAIVEALKQVRQKISPDDLFVFYVASHGTVDDGKYFLITSNVGSTSTARLNADALPQESLTAIFANIPAAKKLIVLDTCNAGRLGDAVQSAILARGMNEDTAVKILSRAVGSTILSAATSSQEALEGYQGHGLFSYVVANGLAGKADADRDGFVKTTELADYVDSEVPELAEKVFHYKQFPVVSPSGMGFPVVRTPGKR
jgi:WD40 repeat protein